MYAKTSLTRATIVGLTVWEVARTKCNKWRLQLHPCTSRPSGWAGSYRATLMIPAWLPGGSVSHFSHSAPLWRRAARYRSTLLVPPRPPVGSHTSSYCAASTVGSALLFDLLVPPSATGRGRRQCYRLMAPLRWRAALDSFISARPSPPFRREQHRACHLAAPPDGGRHLRLNSPQRPG